MKLQLVFSTCALALVLSGPVLGQSSTGSSASPSGSTEQTHKAMDSSQAMASAGFRTLPVSEVESLKLYGSDGEILGSVRQVVRNEKGRDSIVVTRMNSSGGDVVIPLDNVVIHADRLFARNLTDNQIKTMDSVKPGSVGDMEEDKTVMIGAEN